MQRIILTGGMTSIYSVGWYSMFSVTLDATLIRGGLRFDVEYKYQHMLFTNMGYTCVCLVCVRDDDVVFKFEDMLGEHI